MKKGLIFGGIALVIGVGAYLWYKNSLKNISEEAKSEIDSIPKPDTTPAFKKGIEDKLALGISTNQLAIAESKMNRINERGGITPTSFGSSTRYGA